MLVYSTIKYATGVPTLPLNGATIAANTKIWIVYTPVGIGELLPYSFWDNGTKVGNNESVAPFEVFNGNGWTPTIGAHKLDVKQGNLAIKETSNFTIGAVTPPAGKVPVIFNAKTDTTKVEVKFQINGVPV